MKISFILPHKDRTDHLRFNLNSLLAQTSKEFEIILIDNSTEVGKDKLRSMISEFSEQGLKIRGYGVNVAAHPFSHPISEFQGNYNPALQQNIGVKVASGEVIVLSSPEIINAKTNVERLQDLFAEKKSKFLLGWMDEQPMTRIPSLTNGITVEEVKKLCFKTMGGASCREGDWAPLNYFIGCMLKEDFIRIGGIEEQYMAGIAFEDNCFASRCERNGFPAELCPDIAGIHITHSRSYQNFMNGVNHKLWDNHKPLIANEGREWGSEDYVVERMF